MSVDTSSGDYEIALGGTLSSTSVTIIGWAFMPSLPVSGWSLVSLDNGGANFLEISSTGALNNWAVFSDGHGPSSIPMFTAASAVGQWVFFALVGAPGTSTVYWSIGYAAISNTTFASAGNGTDLWIGNDGFAGGFFPGQIVGVKVWSVALTAAQVADEFNKGPPVFGSNVWAYWPLFNAVSGSIDWSGNGRTTTPSGTPADSANMPAITWSANSSVQMP